MNIKSTKYFSGKSLLSALVILISIFFSGTRDSTTYAPNPLIPFQPEQTTTVPNHTVDWESFEVNGNQYLISATYDVNADSKVYKMVNQAFSEIQSISTQRAVDLEHFEINGNHYLAVANSYNGSTGNIPSIIYLWDNTTERFQPHQQIDTQKAADWEHFTIGSDHFLAVANYSDDSSFTINSHIYKWDPALGTQSG